ncbi:MAG: DUF87 domain-containing protein [bacterium]|nr:DUF87 domain-containing protein [bacterium]
MAFNIIVGRNEEDKKKFGDRGTILLGRAYVKMGQTTSLSNYVYLDVIKAHVVFVVGKRGSGKSYSASVIAEGIIDLPEEASKNIAVIMLDTMGVFWTMKYPNEKDADLLEEWNLKPKGMEKIKVFTPFGKFEDAKNKGVPTDYPFSIKASELTGEDWRLAFELPASHPVSILIEKVLGDFAENKIEEYTIDMMITTFEKENTFPVDVRNEGINKLRAAKRWGLFSDEGTKIDVLIKGGTVSILDMSAYATSEGGWGVKALVVGLICKKVFIERMISRQLEEVEAIKVGYSYFKMEEEVETEEKKPLVWFLLDECLTGKTTIDTSYGKDKLSNIIKKHKQGENITVLSFNQITKKLEYKPITKVYEKGKKEIIRIKTETGQELECTENHKIQTINGFQEAYLAEEIAIPINTPYRNNKELIIARLFGSIIGDGYLNQKGTVVGFSGKGSEEDLLRIKEDLKELGFTSSKIQTRQTKSYITTTYGKTHEVIGISQEFTSSTKCHKFFKEKGAPIGKKIQSAFRIPKWLKEANLEVKAEFLAALYGADGMAPSISKACKRDFNPIRLSFNYILTNEEHAKKYTEDLVKLLEDLGIQKNKISQREGNIRKDGKKTGKIIITLSKETINTIRYLDNIGYRYCNKKEVAGKKWLEYLKAKKFEESRILKLKETAITIHKTQGLGKIRIAKILDVKPYQVRDWIYYDIKTRSQNSFQNFEEWVKERVFENQIFERIIEKEKLGQKEVFDISVEGNHTFIANSYIVHNCHELLPAEGKTAATDALVTILREGRQPGISLLLISQQPGKIHSDVLTQSDIVIGHRLTAKRDIDALNSMMQSYLGNTLTGYLNTLPSEPGAAILLDDNSERLFPIRTRPKFSWHGGEAPTAIKYKRSANLGI